MGLCGRPLDQTFAHAQLAGHHHVGHRHGLCLFRGGHVGFVVQRGVGGVWCDGHRLERCLPVGSGAPSPQGHGQRGHGWHLGGDVFGRGVWLALGGMDLQRHRHLSLWLHGLEPVGVHLFFLVDLVEPEP